MAGKPSGLLNRNKNMGITVPENNIAPKNDGFQQESAFPGGPYFQGIPVSFREGNKNANPSYLKGYPP